MKTFFQTRAQTIIPVLFATLSVICLLGAIAIGDSLESDRHVASGPSDPELHYEKEKRDQRSNPGQKGISTEEFLEAQKQARALPPSQIGQFKPFQPGGTTDAFTYPSPSPGAIAPPFATGNEPNWESGRIVALGPDPADANVLYAGGLGGLLKGT